MPLMKQQDAFQGCNDKFKGCMMAMTINDNKTRPQNAMQCVWRISDIRLAVPNSRRARSRLQCSGNITHARFQTIQEIIKVRQRQWQHGESRHLDADQCTPLSAFCRSQDIVLALVCWITHLCVCCLNNYCLPYMRTVTAWTWYDNSASLITVLFLLLFCWMFRVYSRCKLLGNR